MYTSRNQRLLIQGLDLYGKHVDLSESGNGITKAVIQNAPTETPNESIKHELRSVELYCSNITNNVPSIFICDSLIYTQLSVSNMIKLKRLCKQSSKQYDKLSQDVSLRQLQQLLCAVVQVIVV